MIHSAIDVKALLLKYGIGGIILKATGIVRRIDDLGRIVIPKEIRRTLRIREGDPLEIFTDREGEIILKKYSPIGEMGQFAGQYAMAMAKATGYIVLITDTDQIIATGGTTRKDIVGMNISKEVDELLSERQTLIASVGDRKFVQILDANVPIAHEIIVPVIANGDVIGGVILLTKENNDTPAQMDIKVAVCAASFLGMQAEG